MLVDVQNDFCHPNGSTSKAGQGCQRRCHDAAPAPLSCRGRPRCLCARDLRRTTHDESNDSVVWLNRHAAGPGEVTTQGTCRTGSRGAEFYEVAAEPGETVITKHRYSALVGTSLDLTLRTMGVESLLFTGVATDVCVESSLRDGPAASTRLDPAPTARRRGTGDPSELATRCNSAGGSSRGAGPSSPSTACERPHARTRGRCSSTSHGRP